MRRPLALLLSAVLAGSPLAAQTAVAQAQVLNVQDADIRAFIQDVARSPGAPSSSIRG